MKLQLKIIRKKFIKIIISMIFVISLGVALLFGLLNGVLSLNKSVENFIDENNYPDIKIVTEVEDIEKIKTLSNEELKSIEYRLSISTIIKRGNDTISVKVNTFDDNDLNTFYIDDKKINNTNNYEMFVEKRFAKNNNIKLGDNLKLKIDTEFYDFYVSKIISIPEAIVSTPIKGFWGDINNYGNIYINRKVLYEETNKKKNNLLNELFEKENEILNEEKTKDEEYNDAKNKINNAKEEYNKQKKYYQSIKLNLNNKKNDLNKNKELLKEIRKEYLNINSSKDKYEDIVYSYIDEYSNNSSNIKENIDKIIEEKYPNVTEDQLEFITNLSYYIIKGKIGELINQDDDYLKEIFEKIMDDTNLDKLKPYYSQIVQIINSSKDKLQKSIDNIYNNTEASLEKARQINGVLFNYIDDVLDKTTILVLSNYKNNINKKPIPAIDEMLSEIDNGIKDINNNITRIDKQLNRAFKDIVTKNNELDKMYTIFKEEIEKIKQELNDKKEEINNISGYEKKFNEILIRLSNDNNKEEKLSNIKNKYLQDIKVLDSYTYENSPIYEYVNYNVGVMKSLSMVVPMVFYTVILIILFLFISLMIKQNKREISILKLLGKTSNSIRLTFCLSNLLIAIIGIILGIIIGFFPIIYMVNYYKNFFLFTNTIYIIDGKIVLISTIITIIVVEVATIIATREINKISPIEILKKEEYQNKDTSKLLQKIVDKFKPFVKFNILVSLRNKSKLIIAIICTSMTLAMLFSSLAYLASKDKIFSDYFDKRICYDAQIFKSGELNNNDIENIRNKNYVKHADLLRYFNVKVKYNNKEQNLIINALDNTNNYIKIYNKNNKEIKYPENGIVLEEHIANNLGLKINDEININGVMFKIVDISFQSMARVNYISLSDSYKLKSSFDTIVLKMDQTKHAELINEISKDDNYIYTVFIDELRDYNKKIFDSYTLPSIIIIIFTLIIGYIIIININLYNLINQKKNLAIFKILGYGYGEISKNWFVQSLIQWLISIIIGLPVGILLSKYFLKRVGSPGRDFIYASGIKEFIITAFLMFLYIYIGHRKIMSIFKKMDIVEEVKDRD